MRPEVPEEPAPVVVGPDPLELLVPEDAPLEDVPLAPEEDELPFDPTVLVAGHVGAAPTGVQAGA